MEMTGYPHVYTTGARPLRITGALPLAPGQGTGSPLANPIFTRLGPAEATFAAVAAVAPEGVLAGGADRLADDGEVQHAGVAREDLLDDAGFDRGVRIVLIARVNQVARLQRFDGAVATPKNASRCSSASSIWSLAFSDYNDYRSSTGSNSFTRKY
ncbi:unnamed protein product [Tuwongella immobilis]|uniref:Uncharacterized protein n=1 Tax=Tuwongella immobilis TaxID=692036 RepID=A0A6C2YWR6_9BACT|nr:unnamed protein product [Tuwongella immobilis]VTS07906.1 unnamed protein product [Tuwongella immobilis]